MTALRWSRWRCVPGSSADRRPAPPRRTTRANRPPAPAPAAAAGRRAAPGRRRPRRAACAPPRRWRAAAGPIAVDAERASGFRYSQRAYLVQLRRAGAGTALVDPIPLGGDLSALAPALTGPRVGAARGQPGSGLPGRGGARRRPGCSTPSWPAGWPGSPGSGSDRWSSSCWGCRWRRATAPPTGPGARCPRTGSSTPRSTSRCSSSCATCSPGSWPSRASSSGPRRSSRPSAPPPPPAPRAEPWRRTSGVHKLRKPRLLAAVRALWEARDRLAAERDIAPGRVLPDSRDRRGGRRAARSPRGRWPRMPIFRGRAQRRLTSYWFAALREGGRARPRGAARAPRRPPTGRRRSPAGPTATPTPPPGWPPPAPPSPRWASSGPSRWRTCCSPTCCGGCAGARRPTATSAARCAQAAPGSGRSTCCARPGEGARPAADRCQPSPASLAARPSTPVARPFAA